MPTQQNHRRPTPFRESFSIPFTLKKGEENPKIKARNREVLDEGMRPDAIERLHAVFAQTWLGSRRNLAEAFTDFREAILRDSGNKHTEVTVVFPTRNPNAE